MGEDTGAKEDKFNFTSEGEELGYISLEQARVLAIEHARDNTEFYGSDYEGVRLVWEVLSVEDGDDYYDIKLSFRPSGRFRGEPGIEQFIFDKTGDLRVRQMLDEPTGMDDLATGASSAATAPPETPRPRPAVVVPLPVSPVPPAPLSTESDRSRETVVPAAPSAPTRGAQPGSSAPASRPRPQSPLAPPREDDVPSSPNDRARRVAPAKLFASVTVAAVLGFVVLVSLSLADDQIFLSAESSSYEQGVNLYQREEYDGAIGNFDESIRLGSRNASSYYNRGLSRARLGNYELAIQDFSTAIDLDPNHAEAHLARGIASGLLGEDSDSRQDIERAAELRNQGG